MLRWKGVLVVAPMTNEELVERIQSGDADCIEQLLQNNQEYLYKLARRFSRDAGAVEDLVQEGGIAILDAAGSYEPEYGALFLTYATPMIRKAMRDYMAGMSLPMAIPAARYSQLRRVNYLVAKFQAEGESHSLQDLLMMICRELGVSEKVARGLLWDYSTIYQTTILDEYWERNIPCFDVDPAKVYEQELLAECIQVALDELAPRERMLIGQHLGLEGSRCEGMTFRELAVMLNYNGHSAAEKAYLRAVDSVRRVFYAGRYGRFTRTKQVIITVQTTL